MDGIKTALNVYSGSAEGKTFSLLLPTVDDRLREKALFEEDGIYYLQSPIFERPLQVIRPPLRAAFLAKPFGPDDLAQAVRSVLDGEMR